MSRIKLNDLQQDVQISKEEMKRVFGGMTKTELTGFSINRRATDADLTNRFNLGINASGCCCDDDCDKVFSVGTDIIRTNSTTTIR